MHLPQADSELIQIMDAAFADAARRAGTWLVCRPGCSQCCHGAFALNGLDAVRLRQGMDELRADNPVRAAVVEKRAQAWIAEHGPEFPGSLLTGLLGASEDERERFEDFANDAACPALDPSTGRCDLYAARPLTCRVFGPPVRMDAGTGDEAALGHCELCFVGASDAEVAACEMPVPHELEAEVAAEAALQITQTGETVVAFALLR